MSTFTPARRVATMEDLEQPGDYTLGRVILPDNGGEHWRILFLLPIHHGKNAFDRADEGSGLHSIYEPKWSFEHHPDGSVSATPSIGCGDAQKGYYWHGYLRPGNQWEQL